MSRWKCRDCGFRPMLGRKAEPGATTECPRCGGTAESLGRGKLGDLNE